MAETNKEDRTEKATTRQREKARAEGNVVQSEEVNAVFLLIFGLLALYFFSTYITGSFQEILKRYLSSLSTLTVSPEGFASAIKDVILNTLLIVTPVIFVLTLISIAGSYVQIGFLFTTKSLKPRFSILKPTLERLNPFSKEKLVRLAVAFMKIGIIVFVAYKSLRAEIPMMLRLADSSVSSILGYTAMVSFKLILKIGVLFIIAAIADYAFRYYKHEESIKMTKQQVKDERKDLEGDPLIKGKIRNIQIKTAMKRMMKDIPKADVVITNPTHYAIAIKYDKNTMWAPKVVAKGARLVALRIIQIARENNVPVFENKPLAQALYKVVEVGRYIPTAFYRAVAEILAYIYKLRHDRIWV